MLVETGSVALYSRGRNTLKAAKEEGKRLRGIFASIWGSITYSLSSLFVRHTLLWVG